MSKQDFKATSDHRMMSEMPKQKKARLCPKALALGLEIDSAMLEALGPLARSAFRELASRIGHDVLRNASTDEAAAALLLQQRHALADTDHAVLWGRINRYARNLLDEHGNPLPMAGRVLRASVVVTQDVAPQGGGGSGPPPRPQ